MRWRSEKRFETDVLRRLEYIERLLETPTLTLTQLGDKSMIGSIPPGGTGQFGVAVNWPAGSTPDPKYVPQITWQSPDPKITFSPATTDQSGGAIPLSQQIIATVDPTDANANGSVGAAAPGVDGVTPLVSNVDTFAIPAAPPPPPVEPTLVLSQLA